MNSTTEIVYNIVTKYSYFFTCCIRIADFILIFVSDFHNVLTLVVYLILVSIPTVRSAPDYSRMDSTKWTNPCGRSQDEVDSSSGSISNINDIEFVDTVISSIGIALNKANEFKENFVSKIITVNLNLSLNFTSGVHKTTL